jgi:hypothetical protein
MWVLNDNLLFSPGARVAAPTTGSNGQHPRTARTLTSSICNAVAPMLA